MRKPIWIVVIAAQALLAQAADISAERIRAHDRFLASDLLEGVGQRGGDSATEYIATQFALAGAKPAGDNGTYFQFFPLERYRVSSNVQSPFLLAVRLYWGWQFMQTG